MAEDFKSYARRVLKNEPTISNRKMKELYRKDNPNAKLSSQTLSDVMRELKGRTYNIKKNTRAKGAKYKNINDFYRKNPEARNWSLKKIGKYYRDAGGKINNEDIAKSKRDYFKLDFQVKKSHNKSRISQPKKQLIQGKYAYVVEYYVYLNEDEEKKNPEKRHMTIVSNVALEKDDVFDWVHINHEKYYNVFGSKYHNFVIAEDKPMRIVQRYKGKKHKKKKRR